MNAAKQDKKERKIVTKAVREGVAAGVAAAAAPSRGPRPSRGRPVRNSSNARDSKPGRRADQRTDQLTDESSRALFGAIDAAGAGSRSGQFRKLAMSMCLPSVSSPVRASVGVASRPTAVATPFEKKAFELTTGTIVPGYAGSNDAVVVAAYRQFTRANVVQTLTTGFTTFDALPNLSVKQFVNEEGGVNVHHLQDSFAAGATPSIHGSTLFALVCPDESGDTCFWIDSPLATSTVIFTGIAAGTIILTRKWVGDAYTEVASVPTVGPTDTVSLAGGSGYYSFSLSYNAGGNDGSPMAMQVRMQYGAGGAAPTYGYAHTVLPGLLTNIGSFTSGRITAVSAMISNYSAELAKRGRIVGWTAPESADWTQYAAPGGSFLNNTPNPYNVVSSQNNMCELVAADGMYGFLLPCDNEAMTLQPLQDGIVGASGSVAFQLVLEPLLPVDGFLLLVLNCSAPPVAGQVDDRMFVRSSYYHFEGLTGDPWRTTDFSTCAPSAYSDDLALLRKIPTFYSNAWHLADIARKISNVAGWAQPLLTSLGMAGGPYGTPLLALGNAAGAINGLGNAFLPQERQARRRMLRGG